MASASASASAFAQRARSALAHAGERYDSFLLSKNHAYFACAVGVAGGTFCAYEAVRSGCGQYGRAIVQDDFLKDLTAGTVWFCAGAMCAAGCGYVIPFLAPALLPAASIAYITTKIARAHNQQDIDRDKEEHRQRMADLADRMNRLA